MEEKKIKSCRAQTIWTCETFQLQGDPYNPKAPSLCRTVLKNPAGASKAGDAPSAKAKAAAPNVKNKKRRSSASSKPRAKKAKA